MYGHFCTASSQSTGAPARTVGRASATSARNGQSWVFVTSECLPSCGSKPTAGRCKSFRRHHLTTTNESPPVGTGIADPAPLGLAAFALTTFLLSAKNATWMNDATGLAFLPYAFAYGGLRSEERRVGKECRS